MSEPSSSRSPSPAPKIEKKLKKKRKSIAEDAVVEAQVDGSEAAAVSSKAEKKLQKKSSKKASKETADEDADAMEVDGERDAVVEVKKEKKSKKKSKSAIKEDEDEDGAAVVEDMEVDQAQDAASEPVESKANKKSKRKRKEDVEEDEEAPKADGADAGDDLDAAEEEDETPIDEPVLSHAERRRRKKEAKLAAKRKAEAGDDSDVSGDEGEGQTKKKRKLKDGSAKAVADANATGKRQNSVWVGNLSFKTQPENLKTFFDGVGEITRVHMPTKPAAGPGMRPENRGFAYVDFATPEAKIIAITLSENPLLGRKLLIKDGDDFAGRPAAITAEHAITDPALAHKTHSKTAQKILRAQKQPPAPTLFFGNLPFDTTDDTIRELLEAHRSYAAPKKAKGDDGEGQVEQKKEVWIRKVRLGTFEDTGACKGFGFVDFMTIEHATAALINPRNHRLNGRDLVVEYAGPDAVRRGAPKGKGDGVFKGSRAARPERTWGGDKAKGPRKFGGAGAEGQAHEGEGGDAGGAEAHGKGAAGAEAGGEGDDAPRKRAWEHKETLNKDGRHKGPRSRPKPGAALALAKRESTAIVASQGQKITF